jgi:RimJ/RimL family protein N-acetyltransferase
MASPDGGRGSVTIARTSDMALVRSILTWPSLYDWHSDDGSPAREDYDPPQSDAIWYILARDRAVILGIWMLVPQNAIEYEVHTCLLPGHGYKRGRAAAKEAIAWAFANVPHCRRLITKVPAYNRLAYRFAIDAGFELIGIDKQSFLKRGNLLDQAILGLSPTE